MQSGNAVEKKGLSMGDFVIRSNSGNHVIQNLDNLDSEADNSLQV